MTKPKERARIDFTRLESCPKCEADWRDKPIPPESRYLFGDNNQRVAQQQSNLK